MLYRIGCHNLFHSFITSYHIHRITSGIATVPTSESIPGRLSSYHMLGTVHAMLYRTGCHNFFHNFITSYHIHRITSGIATVPTSESIPGRLSSYHHRHNLSIIRNSSLFLMVTLSRYMALHVGDTAPPGTAWAFNKDIKWVIKVIKKMKISRIRIDI